MAKMQVFTLENLTQYDGLIKNYIDTADAKSLKTVAIDGNKLKFYRVSEPVGETAPAYTIELPETDISGLLAKLTGATAGNVVVAKADGTVEDGGVALADLATKEELEEVSDIANANKEALEALNNADTGVVKTVKDYADEKVKELSDGQVKTNKEAIEKLNGDATTEGSVAKSVKDASDAINAKIGTVAEGKTVVEMIEDVIANGYDDEEVRGLIEDNADAIEALGTKVGDVATLKTTEKTSVVGAINEVSDAVASAVDGAKVTISTESTTEGYLKTYTIKQGDAEIGKIDIAKDLVVTAGEVVVDPEGQPEGTYLKLTIANQEAPVYVNVKDLVDAYTAKAGDTYTIKTTGKTEQIANKGIGTVSAIQDKIKSLADGDTVTIYENGSATAGSAYTIGVTTKDDGTKYTADDIANLVKAGNVVNDGTNNYYALPANSSSKTDISLKEAYQKMENELKAASDIGSDIDKQSTVRHLGNGEFEITQAKVEIDNELSFALHVGADADMTNKIGVKIQTMSSSGLGVKGLNVKDDSGKAATYAIDAIADAVATVSAQRSLLGAVQNRLEHTINNLDNVVENTTAAESQIRDTDMATEMVKYSNANILSQAGQSMLAQANQSNQGVLSILG